MVIVQTYYMFDEAHTVNLSSRDTREDTSQNDVLSSP